MLQIHQISLEQDTLTSLAKFQAEVNAIPLDDKWKKNLDAVWKKYASSAALDDVKLKLGKMCPGRMRCCYCEDSAAEGIDHIAPKVYFPHLTFAWKNYLYACAKCNKKKGSTWAIFLAKDEAKSFYKIPRHSNSAPRVFPANEDHVFINPREDDAAHFLQLTIDPKFDKLDFRPRVAALNPLDQIRADFTLKTLKLNSEFRPELGTSRMDAYRDYYDRLAHYQKRKNEDHFGQAELNKIIDRFKQKPHPTVWFEIKRCFKDGSLAIIDREFHDLLATVPEALLW
jgi:uncharacterized protein (TIGR02646 family)